MNERGAGPLRAGGAWALATVVVALAAGLVRTTVVARFLDPVEIGLMGAALLALGFVEAVGSTGLDTALVAGRQDVESYIDPAFTVQVARGLVVAGVIWLAAPAVALAFHSEAGVAVIRSVAAVPALRGFANPAVAFAVRRLDFRRLFWWSLPEMLASLVLTVALAAARRDVWALVLATIGSQAIATLASYGLVPRMPHFVLARERIYELLRFGRFVSGARALMYFSVNLDSAVVGITIGPHALGLYQFALRVAELPVVTFTRAVAQLALPALSRLRATGGDMRRTWRVMLRTVLAVNGAAAIVMVLFGETAVRVVAGERWLAAVPLLRLLAVAMVCRAVIVLTGQLLDALGRPAVTLQLNAVRLAGLVALVPLLAAVYDLSGIAGAVVLANAGASMLALWLAHRTL